MNYQILVTYFATGPFMVVLHFSTYDEAETAYGILFDSRQGRWIERLYHVKKAAK